MRDLAERIQKATAKRGNMAKLAELAEVSHTEIQKLRDGKVKEPGYNTVKNVERALDELEKADPSKPAETVLECNEGPGSFHPGGDSSPDRSVSGAAVANSGPRRTAPGGFPSLHPKAVSTPAGDRKSDSQKSAV